MSLEPTQNTNDLENTSKDISSHSDHQNNQNNQNNQADVSIAKAGQSLQLKKPLSKETEAKNKKMLMILLAVVFGFFISVFLKYKR